MISEKKERNILLLSFISGIVFAIVEIAFSIYNHSQAVLMDGIYDATELIFIGLTLFLTPLFRKPISEKYPYGFYQVESIYIIIKGFMMLSVSFGMGIDIAQKIINGGNNINENEVSIFQVILGIVSFLIFLTMKHWNKKASSPTVDAEIIGWKLDFSYSLGLSFAFFLSSLIRQTPLSVISPYVDPFIAIIVMLIMIPETVKLLWAAIKDVFLFSPDKDMNDKIKKDCGDILNQKNLQIKYVDVIRTGRVTWVSLYFITDEKEISVEDLKIMTDQCNEAVKKLTDICKVELILAP